MWITRYNSREGLSSLGGIQLLCGNFVYFSRKDPIAVTVTDRMQNYMVFWSVAIVLMLLWSGLLRLHERSFIGGFVTVYSLPAPQAERWMLLLRGNCEMPSRDVSLSSCVAAFNGNPVSTTEISSVQLAWFWSRPGWVVAYIARAIIAWNTIVFYRQLRRKQAIEQGKIPKFPLWPAGSFIEVRVSWAVLWNVSASTNKYDVIYTEH